MAEWKEQGDSPEQSAPEGQSAAAITDAEKERLPEGMADAAQSDEPAAGAQSEEEMNAMIEQLCLSKAEEFRLIGYEHVNGQDIWECVSDKYHKKGTPPLYQVVNDILSLKVTQFMNFITLNMYRGDNRG